MNLIRVHPLDLGGPTLLNLVHVEGARPEARDGKPGFVLFVGGRAAAWVSDRTMSRLRAGQPCEGEACTPRGPLP